MYLGRWLANFSSVIKKYGAHESHLSASQEKTDYQLIVDLIWKRWNRSISLWKIWIWLMYSNHIGCWEWKKRRKKKTNFCVLFHDFSACNCLKKLIFSSKGFPHDEPSNLCCIQMSKFPSTTRTKKTIIISKVQCFSGDKCSIAVNYLFSFFSFGFLHNQCDFLWTVNFPLSSLLCLQQLQTPLPFVSTQSRWTDKKNTRGNREIIIFT